eukprot:TRINITY_DN8407_c0_g4_i1.p1 TRINITY_DN8407_c0_g4~~TRINITY_DN8407_c0_g4_i1.p1  ORF type:complete len:464 (+),score=160.91 TRINITY_DN8407_c0_g4_i1:48-1394(+)
MDGALRARTRRSVSPSRRPDVVHLPEFDAFAPRTPPPPPPPPPPLPPTSINRASPAPLRHVPLHTLRVSAPMCAGVGGQYLQADVVNGCPSWIGGEDGRMLLYAGPAPHEHWYVTDDPSDCSSGAGFIASLQPHHGRGPHEITRWAYADGYGGWKEDGRVCLEMEAAVPLLPAAAESAWTAVPWSPPAHVAPTIQSGSWDARAGSAASAAPPTAPYSPPGHCHSRGVSHSAASPRPHGTGGHRLSDADARYQRAAAAAAAHLPAAARALAAVANGGADALRADPRRDPSPVPAQAAPLHADYGSSPQPTSVAEYETALRERMRQCSEDQMDARGRAAACASREAAAAERERALEKREAALTERERAVAEQLRGSERLLQERGAEIDRLEATLRGKPGGAPPTQQPPRKRFAVVAVVALLMCAAAAAAVVWFDVPVPTPQWGGDAHDEA